MHKILFLYIFFTIFIYPSAGHSQDVATAITIDTPRPLMAGAAISFTVTNAPAGSEIQWNFGDGTTLDFAPNQATVEHTFEDFGNYLLAVNIRNGTNSNLVTQNIIVGAAANNLKTVLRNSTLVLDDARDLIWTVNPDNDSISAVSRVTNRRMHEVSLDNQCVKPANLALDGYNRIWVTCRDNDRIAIVNAATRAVQTLALPWGSNPAGIIIDTERDEAYISAYSKKSLIVMNADTQQASITKVVTNIGEFPEAMSKYAGDAEIYVARFISDADTGGEIYVIDVESGTKTDTLIIEPDTTTPESSSSAPGIANYLAGITLNPSVRELVIVGNKANIFGGIFRRDGDTTQDLRHDTTVRAQIWTIDLASSEVIADRTIDADNHVSPSSVVMSREGTFYGLTFQANNMSQYFDARRSTRIASFETSLAPDGIIFDYKHNKIYTRSLTERLLDIREAEGFLATSNGLIEDLAPVKLISQDKLTPEVLLGKQVFYNASDERMSSEGYVSCALCHLDGGHDGMVWDFTGRGEGLRNTQTLNGMGDSPMFHWSGNFDEIQDFEHDIRGAFAGSGFMSDVDFNSGNRNQPLGGKKAGFSEELDALAAYVDTLRTFIRSPYKNADGTLSAAAQSGREVFNKLQCAQCHSGTLGTDSETGKRHDVGTIKPSSGKRLDGELDGFDTPTIIGLADTAPYFHDGSAKTLQAVFSTGAHDIRQTASTTEINNLVRYLLELDTPVTGATTPTPAPPSEPVEPEEPATPQEPAEPAPTNPDPVEPTTPTEPANPGTGGNNGNNNGNGGGNTPPVDTDDDTDTDEDSTPPLDLPAVSGACILIK